LRSLERVRTTDAVREIVSGWRAAGDRIALVPTMGNLHPGHLSLAEVASANADRVIATIFVNPTQFGPREDIDRYPRTPVEDEALLEDHGRTDLLFAPTETDIYPRGTEDIVTVCLPALADDLCGRSRPGHFNGVASVVLRLLNIACPDVLVMGQKDYQQLVLLRRMIEDLHLAVELISVPTVRETDGLAMSSRNQYLEPGERKVAPELYATLSALAAKLREGCKDFDARRAEALAVLKSRGFRPDYLELRDARDLTTADAFDQSRDRILLAAAWLGRARLIDNVLV